MIHVITTHQTPRWAEPQMTALRSNTGSRFRVYCFRGPDDGEAFTNHYFAEPAPNESEAANLNMLASLVLMEAAPEDLIVFLRADTLVLPGWESHIRGKVRQFGLTAVRRTENEELAPHPAFCATSIAFWREFGIWEENAVAGNLGTRLQQRLYAKRVEWHPLLRTNRLNLHPLRFGLYGTGRESYVYYHGTADERRRPREKTVIEKLRSILDRSTRREMNEIENAARRSDYVYKTVCYLNGRSKLKFQDALEQSWEFFLQRS